MSTHLVDPHDRGIDSDDLACWLLFFLEAHGATVTLTPGDHVHVDLDPMPGLDAETVARWAPTIAVLLPTFRVMLRDRLATQDATLH